MAEYAPGMRVIIRDEESALRMDPRFWTSWMTTVISMRPKYLWI